MEIVETLDNTDRIALIKFLREQYDLRLKSDSHFRGIFSSHIDIVINRPHFFKVHLFAADYKTIFIGFNLHQRAPYYQTLFEVVEYIQNNENILHESGGRTGTLDGNEVKKYLNAFNNNTIDLQNCFVQAGNCFMQEDNYHPSGGKNITDGMHRLVAYGLASELKDEFFPIPIYFGTDFT